jgi:hypothetical protein
MSWWLWLIVLWLVFGVLPRLGCAAFEYYYTAKAIQYETLKMLARRDH